MVMGDGFERTGDLLAQLSAVGSPSLRRMDSGGWYAHIKFPAPDGVRADVGSRFDHDTPEEALQLVIDRLGGLRSMLSVPSPTIGATHAEIAG